MAGIRCVYVMFSISSCLSVMLGFENRDLDVCSGKRCLGAGRCHSSPTLGICVCLQGYKWADASLEEDCHDVDECANHYHDPCGHRGTCTNTVGSYRCQCLTGWEGANHCDINATGPSPPCMPGYHGNMCDDSDCGQYGYPSATGNGDDFVPTCISSCICRSGWTNTEPDKPCDVEINACLDENTCQHGATCEHLHRGHYRCHCSSGWVGRNCTDYDCTINMCSNGGSCVNKTCQCATGWFGQDCSVKDCTPSCLNGGICVGDTCRCIGQWTGSYCDTKMCLVECKNGGACMNGRCKCSSAWKGHDCSTTAIKQGTDFTLYASIGGGMAALALCSFLAALIIRHKLKRQRVKDNCSGNAIRAWPKPTETN